TVPSVLVTTVNFSQAPMAVRLAISGLAPPLSAVTILPLDLARNETVPSLFRMRSNCSHGRAAAALAIRGEAPEAGVVTNLLLTTARRAVVLGRPEPTRSSRSGEPARAFFTAPRVPLATSASRTCCGVQLGFADRSSAAAPAAC